MKMYLELESKLGPKPRSQPQNHLQQIQPQPNTSACPKTTNCMTRKAPGTKASDKRKRTMLTKRRYKVRVLAWPTPTTTTPTAPTHTVATASTQMPMKRSTATSILVMVYKLATGQFAEVPHPTTRPQTKGHPSVQSSKPPPLEDIPKAPVRQGTPWPSTGSPSKNFLKQEKTSQFPLYLHLHPQLKQEPHPKYPYMITMPKQAAEKCSWGLHYPICKNEKEHDEDWGGNMEREQPRMHPQNTQEHHKPQSQKI